MFVPRLNFLFVFLFLSIFCIAQKSPTEKSEYVDPHIIGKQRPAGFLLGYEGVMNYNIVSTSPEFLGNSTAEVINDRRILIKLKAPVINKDKLKIAVGLNYFQEEFSFDDPETLKYPLYRSLNDKHLRSTSFAFYMIKPSKKSHFFMLRFKVELNGDYASVGEMFNEKYLKFSFGTGIGWKKNDYTSYGIGIGYSYTFGKPSVYPIILYDQTFNKHWGIEAFLPLNFKVRYSVSDKNYFKGIVEFKGAGYNLNLENPIFSGYPDVELGWSEIRFLLSYEREIHDWLWFGVSAGYRKNIRFNVTEHMGNRNFVPFSNYETNYLVKSEASGAPIINAKLFIVVPRKFYNK